MNEIERMSTENILQFSHVWCVHDNNSEATESIKSKTKFEMKSINFIRKRAMPKRGEKETRLCFDSFFLGWQNERSDEFYFFFTISFLNTKPSSARINSKQSEQKWREKNLIRDVRRIQFRIKLWRQCRDLVFRFLRNFWNFSDDDSRWEGCRSTVGM